MSHQAVSAVLSTTGSRGNARCVLVALAHRADAAGRCWPSVEVIAADANVSVRTAQAMLADLADAGEIVIDRNAGPSRTNVYVVTCATPQDLHPAEVAAVQVVAAVQHVAGVQTVAPRRLLHPNNHNSDSFPNGQESAAPPRTRKAATHRTTEVAVEPKRKTASPRIRKPAEPPDPRVKAMTDALAEWQGYTTCNWPAEGAAAKRIVKAGYTLDETRRVWRQMKAEPFWADKHLPLATVYVQLGAKLGKPGARREVRIVEPMVVPPRQVQP